MAAQSIERPRIKQPRKGTKAEAVLTLTATTPATPAEIADSVNTSRQLVHQTLQRYGIKANDADSFKKHKADILNGLQCKIISQLDEGRLKKASVNNLAYAFQQFHNAERLETGQTTGNIGVGIALSQPLQESIDAIIQRRTPVDNSIPVLV